MRTSRAITWARLRVYFGVLPLALFALEALVVYVASLADRQRGRGRTDLRVPGTPGFRAGSPQGLLPGALTDPGVRVEDAPGSSRCGISLSLTRLGRFAVTRW